MEGFGRVRVFHALRYRDFRLLFAGQAVSLIGDAAFLTALGWRTYTLVGAGRFGIVLFCQATGLLATLLIGVARWSSLLLGLTVAAGISGLAAPGTIIAAGAPHLGGDVRGRAHPAVAEGGRLTR